MCASSSLCKDDRADTYDLVDLTIEVILLLERKIYFYEWFLLILYGVLVDCEALVCCLQKRRLHAFFVK